MFDCGIRYPCLFNGAAGTDAGAYLFLELIIDRPVRLSFEAEPRKPCHESSAA